MQKNKPVPNRASEITEFDRHALVAQITNENRHSEVVTGAPDSLVAPQRKKRKSGIPTGNAGEYFVMGELLRQEFDAQLADRNTKGYDLVVGRSEGSILQRIQVKTV